jgi:DNA-binding transcriptional LysR family regulator
MRFERLDLNLLVALDALIEERSVSVAARRIYLSQPALSGALNRLREYFHDALLVPLGRQMVLTPKAEQLRGPVREALMLIRAKITTPAVFDAATAERHFTIIASDFVYDVLLVGLFAELGIAAPNLSFDVLTTGRRSTEMMDRGEADLQITLSGFLNEDHPHLPLFEDDFAVIACRKGRYGQRLTGPDFFDANHAVVLFGGERHPAFAETYFSQQGVQRKVQLRVPSFAALPAAVVGTDRIATMYRSHAAVFARHLPIAIHAPPVPMPTMVEEVQWHSLRGSDAGLQWVVGQLREHATRLATKA